MPARLFKRKIYAKILQWKNESQGKTALLIEGPRRVGKSTIVKEFASREYKSHIIIDFNKVSQEIKALFDNLMDLEYIFLYLQTVFHVSLINRESVIIFDEIQNCPKARQAIKYLVEDGRYDYIETGSLISIKKNTDSITIPSEEERISMHPMDFEEFQWAVGKDNVVQILSTFWSQKRALGSLHREIMRQFRLYMLIGVMPQAVVKYLDTNDFSKVDAVKRRIIRLYEDDFMKIDASGKTSKLFMAIPSQLSKNAIRYSSNAVVGRQKDESLLIMIGTLSDSKTVNVSYYCDDPNVGMNRTKNEKNFKLYMADTGLFITLAFWDKDITDNIIYEKMLSDKLSANLGYIYENMVSQILVSMGNELFYYTWKRDEKHYYEIDFLIATDFKISPIEVKSSSYSRHASLDAFCLKYSDRVLHPYVIAPKEYYKDMDVTILPPYYLPFMK